MVPRRSWYFGIKVIEAALVPGPETVHWLNHVRGWPRCRGRGRGGPQL